MRNCNSLITPKNVKGDSLGFFIIHLVAENQNNQKGDPLQTSKYFEQKVTIPKKTVKHLLSCLVTKKASKTMVTNGGTLWKHPRLLSSKVERKLLKVDLSGLWSGEKKITVRVGHFVSQKAPTKKSKGAPLAAKKNAFLRLKSEGTNLVNKNFISKIFS